MIKNFLKIAGVKSESEFYKKYPSEAAFFRAHPDARDLKKYKNGGQQKKLNQLTGYQGDIDNLIPMAQTGFISDGRDIARSMMAKSDNTSVSRSRDYEREQRDAEINKKKALAEMNARTASKRSSVGPAKKLTPAQEEANKYRKRRYVSEHPYSKLDDQDNITRTQWDRNTEGVADANTTAAGIDKGLTHFQNAMEAAGAITGLSGVAKKLLQSSIGEGIATESASLHLTDEEMARAMREIEEAGIDPSLLDFDPNPSAETLAERARLKDMFKKLDADEAAKTLDEDLMKLKTRAQYGPQPIEKGNVNSRNISKLLGEVGEAAGNASDLQYYYNVPGSDKSINLMEGIMDLDEMTPYSGKEAFSKLRPNRYGGITYAQDGTEVRIGSYLGEPTTSETTTMRQPINLRSGIGDVTSLITGSTDPIYTENPNAGLDAAANIVKSLGSSMGKGKNGKKASKIPNYQYGGYTFPGAAPGSIQNNDPMSGIMWGNPTITGAPTPAPTNPNAPTTYDISAQTGYDPNVRPISEMMGKGKTPFDPTKFLNPIGSAIGAIKEIKEAKRMEKEADKQFQLSGLVSKAAMTRPEPIKRRYVRPEDSLINPNEAFPTYGVGTNYLAEDGTIVKAQKGGGYGCKGKSCTMTGDGIKKHNSRLSLDGSSGVVGDYVGLSNAPVTWEELQTYTDDGLTSKQLKDKNKAVEARTKSLQSQFPGVTKNQVLAAMGDSSRIRTSMMDLPRYDKPQNQTFDKAWFPFYRGIMQPNTPVTVPMILQHQSQQPGGLQGYEQTVRGNYGRTKAQDGTEIGGNETEIQNMYNPHDLYENLGYEPLDDSDIIKKFQFGGISADSFGQIGSQLGAIAGGGGQGTPGGWSHLFGSIPGPIGMVGSMIGSVIDGRQQARIRNFQKGAQRNVVNTAFQQGIQGLYGQNSSYMEEGGWVSNDWQPQVIASFGGNRVSDLLKSDPMMDTLRTGGHISENEMGPVTSMALGGELKTHWGGYAEPISHNPYLPDNGETVMFRGNSHEESDGKGNTGIGVTFGQSPVEVERGEPAVKLKDGGTGEDNMVVYGNLKIPNQYLSEIGDPKAKGKKFKSYVTDLAKQEAKHNKTIQKNLQIIDGMDDITSFDQMKFFSAKANIDGANMKLKQIAERKINAAAVQDAINQTAEQYGLDADALSKNKFKLDKEAMNNVARFGKMIRKAKDGDPIKSVEALATVPSGQSASSYGYGDITLDDIEEMKKNNPWYDWTNFNYEKKSDIKKFQIAFNKKAKEVGSTVRLTQDGKLGKQTVSSKAVYDTPPPPTTQAPTPPPTTQVPGQTPPPTTQKPNETITYKVIPQEKTTWIDFANQIIPFIRPTDQEPLDPTQMYGEMYALATNQVEPVQAQLYHPLLEQPYDISLQDQLNANQADFNSAQRMVGYNPAAASQLAAQKYAANSKVLADQFRANQEMKAGVYNRNRETLNQAQLQNLGILDQQMVRQETAKSRSKEVAQAALNSISDKIAKNKLENRTLSIYENMYNYRFDKSGRAINMNPLFKPNIPNVYNGVPILDKDGNIIAYQSSGSSSAILPPLPSLPSTTGNTTTQKYGGKTPSLRNRDILRAVKGL